MDTEGEAEVKIGCDGYIFDLIIAYINRKKDGNQISMRHDPKITMETAFKILVAADAL